MNQKAGEGDAAQTVKNINVRRNVLTSNVLSERPDFKAIIKPIVNFTHVIEKPKIAELVNNFMIAVTYFNTYDMCR
jgi:hypothetical protein